MNAMKYRNLMVPTIATKTFFDDAFARNLYHDRPMKRSFGPFVNIKETNEKFVIDVAAPGLDKADFKLEILGEALMISSEKKTENVAEQEKVTRREFNYAGFSRSFALPETVDSDLITAFYEHGILSVALPKKQDVTKNKARLVQVG
jgi:HSP20 family protein